MSELIASLALLYLAYRLVCWASSEAIVRMPEGIFSFLTGTPVAAQWKWKSNFEDSFVNRVAYEKAAKDVGIKIKFGRPRGGFSGMAAIFVEAGTSDDDGFTLQNRQWEILAGRWCPSPPPTPTPPR